MQPSFNVKADPALLAEAKKRGFYDSRCEWEQYFHHLFFNGGRLNIRDDIDETFKVGAITYLKGLMRSFEPKHEEKAAICAMLLSETCVLPEQSIGNASNT